LVSQSAQVVPPVVPPVVPVVPVLPVVPVVVLPPRTRLAQAAAHNVEHSAQTQSLAAFNSFWALRGAWL
jgi:hypothetical protein